MFIARLLLAHVAIFSFMVANATGQEASEYRLHFTGVSCVLAPCPQWHAVDVRGGPAFEAVVDFSAAGGQPKTSALNDVFVYATKAVATSPSGFTYITLVAHAIGNSTSKAQVH